jgi:hypothetical protein
LRGREGFGIRRFCESEMPIFHCAGGEVSKAKGPSDVGSRVTGRVQWLTLGAAQLGAAPTHPIVLHQALAEQCSTSGAC